MKVKVIKDFFDKEHNLVHRKVNETFDVTEKRGEHLISRKVVEEVKQPKLTEKKTQKSN